MCKMKNKSVPLWNDKLVLDSYTGKRKLINGKRKLVFSLAFSLIRKGKRISSYSLDSTGLLVQDGEEKNIGTNDYKEMLRLFG